MTNKPQRMFYEAVEPKDVKFRRRILSDLEAQQEIEEYMKHPNEEETHAPVNEVLRSPS